MWLIWASSAFSLKVSTSWREFVRTEQWSECALQFGEHWALTCVCLSVSILCSRVDIRFEDTPVYTRVRRSYTLSVKDTVWNAILYRWLLILVSVLVLVSMSTYKHVIIALSLKTWYPCIPRKYKIKLPGAAMQSDVKKSSKQRKLGGGEVVSENMVRCGSQTRHNSMLASWL